MEKKRVVVTGLGVVAPNGIGKAEFWRNCQAGVSGIKPIILFDTSPYRCHLAGEISDFHPERYLDPKSLRNFNCIPCGQLATRIVESPYRPKEVIVHGLNLEAADKQTIEHLSIQYVDQRRSFTKLITTVKQTALCHGLEQG